MQKITNNNFRRVRYANKLAVLNVKLRTSRPYLHERRPKHELQPSHICR